MLENLVAALEDFLVPPGFKVTKREPFYNDHGKQIGEIDITIRGELGSFEVFYGVECRDRPSEGPQDREWIRGVKAKKDDLIVDKMIAVSTTGFTSTAVEFAKEVGIELRTIEPASKLDMRDWFEVFEVEYSSPLWDIDGILNIVTVPKITAAQMYSDRLVMKDPTSGQSISFNDFIAPHLAPVFRSFAENPDIKEKKKNVPIDCDLIGVLEEQEFKIVRIDIPVRWWRETVKGQVLFNVYKRFEPGGKIIALSGICRIKPKGQKFLVLTDCVGRITPSQRRCNEQILQPIIMIDKAVEFMKG